MLAAQLPKVNKAQGYKFPDMCMARKRIVWLTCFLAKMHFRGRKSKTHHKPCEETTHIHCAGIGVCQEAVRLRESQLPKALLPRKCGFGSYFARK